jgi:hypothetical protein
MEAAPVTQAAQFVKRWSTSGGSERANYALFLTELCDLLGVPFRLSYRTPCNPLRAGAALGV